MGLEAGTYISDLVATNPLGTDPKSQGDNHIRLVKATIKASFPNVNGAVNPTPAEFNHLVGVTAGVQSQLNLKATIVYVDAGLAALDAAKAEDSAVVKLTGTQSVAGAKSFSDVLAALAGIELGHASDTTLARIAAGRVSIEGVEVVRVNTSPQLATIELGHASDTTLARIAAGRASIEGGEIAKLNGTQPFTTKQQFQATPSAPNTTAAEVRHADGNDYDVGLNVMPVVGAAADTTIARTHVGKILRHPGSTPHTYTTPPSTDTDVPLGSTINIVAYGGGAVTIAGGSGVTLERFNGTGAPATGSRTLSHGGVATLYRFTSSIWYVWGNAGLN